MISIRYLSRLIKQPALAAARPLLTNPVLLSTPIVRPICTMQESHQPSPTLKKKMESIHLNLGRLPIHQSSYERIGPLGIFGEKRHHVFQGSEGFQGHQGHKGHQGTQGRQGFHNGGNQGFHNRQFFRFNRGMLLGFGLFGMSALGFKASQEFIKDDSANLLECPTPDSKHPLKENTQITIGDLHGNALKLLYFIVRQNVAIIDPKDYRAFAEIYTKPVEELTADDLQNFNNIVKNITINKGALVRLMGDELCDRGNNDYFTLKLLERISQGGSKLEIILSNHGIEFINIFENDFKEFKCYWPKEFAGSMYNLGTLVEKGLVEKQEITEIVKKHYLPNLKLVSYSLDPSLQGFTYFAHAPTSNNNIKALAQQFKVNYKGGTILELANTIEDINEKFSNFVANKQILSCVKFKEYKEYRLDLENRTGIKLYCDNAPMEFPVIRSIWNRGFSLEDDAVSMVEGYIPFHDFGFTNVHGHDGGGDVENHHYSCVINLDNHFGKSPKRHTGEYTILYSIERSLTPEERAKHKKEERINHKNPVQRWNDNDWDNGTNYHRLLGLRRPNRNRQ